MATKYHKGKKFKVTLGAKKVVGMFSVQMSGVTLDRLEETEFGNEWKQYCLSLKDGGTVSMNGLLLLLDTAGQTELRRLQVEGTDISNLRVYVNDTSYFELCQTTGYFSPWTTTGASTEVAHANIETIDMGADKSGLATCSMTFVISGPLVLI